MSELEAAMAGEQDENSTEEQLREQLEALKEQSQRLREEAAERERELKARLHQEARERESETRGRRHDERDEHREDRRGPRRGGRGGGYWSTPGGPPLPPMPPMPPGGPLPPIPGAGGTFTPFDVLGGLGAMFGPPPGGPAGRRRHGGRGRAGRGDVRITILILLDEGPANGYQLMQEIEQRTNGQWKPSSGSIYPALQQLEDEGIVQTTEGEGRKMFALTEQGKTYVRENRAKWTPPWEGMEEDEGPSEEAVKIRDVIAQLAMAYMQVIQVGTDSQRSEASRVLVGARQALYRILAGDSSED
ncbi:DNA-binding PadR family transcriptional regulator [Catenulispora sp. GP43]|uniref:PadR family transcriptional regulator n=1 Tax=Catenulispora sp. GP43 TaxID=3156263 RepID=UPI0035198E60